MGRRAPRFPAAAASRAYLAGLADTLLASAEGTEVLGRLGDDVGEQLREGGGRGVTSLADRRMARIPPMAQRRGYTYLHDDAAGRGAADGDIEEDLGVGHVVFVC